MTYSALAKEGIRIMKEIRLDQLEGLDLGQLEIVLDMIWLGLHYVAKSPLYIKGGYVSRKKERLKKE